MKSSLQNRIAPPTLRDTRAPVTGNRDLTDTVKDGNADPKVDFKSVLFNSAREMERERDAKKVGDLSSATNEEFLQKLSEQTNAGATVPNNKLGKEDFLRLFIEQLKNQDPLNPDSGAELAAKLAQFNSVEQMTNVNKSLEKLAEAQSLDRSLMMTNFIGKDMTVKGGRLRIEGEQMNGATYALPRGAAKASIDIRDQSGALVHSIDIGSVPEGEHKLEWDGRTKNGDRAPDGVFTFHVNAHDVDGAEVPVELTSRVRITGVDVGDRHGELYTDFGKVNLTEVEALGEVGFQKRSAQEVPNQTAIKQQALKQYAAAAQNGAVPSSSQAQEATNPSSQAAALSRPSAQTPTPTPVRKGASAPASQTVAPASAGDETAAKLPEVPASAQPPV